MKIKWPRLPDGAAVMLGLAILLLCGVLAICAQGGEFSDWERRYLADAPTKPDWLDWDTDKKVESFLTDHMPGRQALVAMDSAVQVLTGRRTQLEAWLVGNTLVEAPVLADVSKLERNLNRLGALAEKAEIPWLVLTPPTHGWLLREQMTPLMAEQYEPEAQIYSYLNSIDNAVAMPEAFMADPEAMYYSTDHHWTLQGAYQAYLALGKALGYEPLPLDAFKQGSYEPFQGTTLSRSGLPPLWQDTLNWAEPDSPVMLTIAEDGTQYDHLNFPEAAQSYDGYAVYLNGNHGLLTLERPSAPEGTLIVYKDSFANCLLPLLSQHYRQIIAVDARYYSGMFSDAIRLAENPKAVLLLYSLDSLVNDTSIVRKAR